MPKKMVIVGSGAIGVEFAYFYKSMGVDVNSGRVYGKYCSS